MQIEQAPTEKPYEKPEGERRGLVLVNTGDGKGKSTAAFGLALRAQGLGDGFSWKSQDHERSAQIAREGWERARAAILSGDHFLVVLDEITYPLIYGWLPLEPVLQALADRPRHVHVMLTGRRCPEEIMAVADTVTRMELVKHAFQAGIPAQRGIED
jgi:cob(I)alamin adenosyltransferase